MHIVSTTGPPFHLSSTQCSYVSINSDHILAADLKKNWNPSWENEELKYTETPMFLFVFVTMRVATHGLTSSLPATASKWSLKSWAFLDCDLLSQVRECSSLFMLGCSFHVPRVLLVAFTCSVATCMYGPVDVMLTVMRVHAVLMHHFVEHVRLYICSPRVAEASCS